MSKRLKYIDFSQIIHTDDAMLKSKLDGIPGFRDFMINTVCVIKEKYIGIEYAGNGVHVNSQSLPEVYGVLRDVCDVLGAEVVPDFSLMWYYGVAAGLEGVKRPVITAMSGAIDLLNREELTFLLGHEMGHQMCGHKPYHMMLETLFLPLINTIPGGDKWIGLIRTSLLNWYRVSDFTADRMGLLACQDIHASLSTLVKISGIPKRFFDSINVDAFIKQALDFERSTSDIMGSIVNVISLNAACSPWTVNRAAKLLEWYNSGEYEKIINK